MAFLGALAGTFLAGCSTAPAPVEDRGAPVPARASLPTVPERPVVSASLAPVTMAPAPAASQKSADALFFALSTLGIDYRSGGRSPTTGFDCSGLVSHIYSEAYGKKIPPNTKAQSSLGETVSLSELEPGDLVFFNTLQRPFSHVGIYIGGERFVHAPRTGASVRIESLKARYWSARFDGARRLIE